MARPRKNQGQGKSESSEGSQNSSPKIVDVELGGDQPEGSGGGVNLSDLINRAQSNLGSAGPEEQKPKRHYTRRGSKDVGDVATLIVTLVTLGISAWNVPEDLKPNQDEIGLLSERITSLLLRHVNIAGKLTQDALDVIGILAVASGYYARTKSRWDAFREMREVPSEPHGPISALRPPIPTGEA